MTIRHIGTPSNPIAAAIKWAGRRKVVSSTTACSIGRAMRKTQVQVAGGGPVGLTVAIVLGRLERVYGRDAFLVRPDQHIAWHGSQASAVDGAKILASALAWKHAP